MIKPEPLNHPDSVVVCVAGVNGKQAPVPVNIDSVNALLGKDIKTEDEMKAWLEMTQV